MNSIYHPNVFMRSFATRTPHRSVPPFLREAIQLLQLVGFDLIWIETAGIGQADTEITDYADLTVYVMTPEFGAPSQLEKIDMLEYADFVVLNKFDRKGAQDALYAVRKQYQRNFKRFLGAAGSHAGISHLSVQLQRPRGKSLFQGADGKGTEFEARGLGRC
jgi:isobutyryl-CoA mutase